MKGDDAKSAKTGYVERRDGKPAYIRLSLPGGARKRIRLPKACSEALAEERRAYYAGLLAEGRLVVKPAGVKVSTGALGRVGGLETVDAWFGRWCTLRRAKGLRSVSDDEGGYRSHIGPKIGQKAMAKVTQADVEDVRDALDGKIRARLAWEIAGSPEGGRTGGRKPGVAPKTAANAWGLLTTMFRDAARSKQRDLRVREDNPSTDIEGPDDHAAREGGVLFPSEFLRLVRCAAVPLRFRQLVTLQLYTFMRQGELRARRWRDVDLEHGRITINTAVSRKTGAVGATKTSSARSVAIEPTLVPLLEMLEDEPHELVTWMPPEEDAARLLRKWLLVAGVDRPELHTDTATTRKIVWHDLRHCACSWGAARGDSAFQLMAASGHASIQTLQRYVGRWGNVSKATFGEPFPALPAELLATFSGHTPRADRDSSTILGGYVVTPTGIEPVLPA